MGRYNNDTGAIINELKIPKSTDFSGKPGGFNLLNTPDELYVNPEQFWNEFNKPWLDQAISKGDEILLATKPTDKNLYVGGTSELTGFGREFFYLLEHGYQYLKELSKMVKI